MAHYQPEMETKFLQIHTTTSSDALEVTSDHLVFLQNGTAVRASKIRVGDVLDGVNVVVNNITHVVRRGAYAPLTESGEFLANDMRVSSYVAIWADAWVPRPHWWGQLLFSPIRILCRLLPDFCTKEQHDPETGFSAIYGFVIELLVRMGNGSFVLAQMTSVLAFLPLVAFWIVENVTLRMNFTLLFGLIVAGAAWLLAGNRKKR